MYAGRIVETGPTDAVHSTPDHPDAEGLLRAARRRERPGHRGDRGPRAKPSPADARVRLRSALSDRGGAVQRVARGRLSREPRRRFPLHRRAAVPDARGRAGVRSTRRNIRPLPSSGAKRPAAKSSSWKSLLAPAAGSGRLQRGSAKVNRVAPVFGLVIMERRSQLGLRPSRKTRPAPAQECAQTASTWCEDAEVQGIRVDLERGLAAHRKAAGTHRRAMLVRTRAAAVADEVGAGRGLRRNAGSRRRRRSTREPRTSGPNRWSATSTRSTDRRPIKVEAPPAVLIRRRSAQSFGRAGLGAGLERGRAGKAARLRGRPT
jgi:hypothetical protein